MSKAPWAPLTLAAHLSRSVTPVARGLNAGVLVVRFPDVDHRRLYELLYTRYGIAGAALGGGLRLCPHVYNTMTDVERTVTSVRSSLRELA